MGYRRAGVATAVLTAAVGVLVAGGPPDAGAPERADAAVAWPALAAGSAAIGRDDPAYHARGARETPTLRNTRHALRARVDRSGVRLGGTRVSLDRVGRSVLTAVPRASATRHRANRVVLRRAGLDEWYVNGPLGLEQGFTLRARPRGSGRIVLALGVHGARVTSVDEDGRGAELSDGLAYRGLWAGDADGRELPARMRRTAGGLRLEIDDAGARYPLTVDPVFQQSRLSTSNGAPLSGAVASDGDTVVFGALLAGGTAGAAYVFRRPAAGWSPTMTESARLTASDGVGGDRLGASVAISGSTIAVGAPLHKVGANDEQGAVYVFQEPAGGWAGTLTETQKLTAAVPAARDRLGSSVALRADELVAGASERGSKVGAAYVFVRAGGAWSQAAELIPAGTRIGNDQFGFAAALGDGFAAVGTLNQGNANPGSVWIFDRPPGGWTGTVVSSQRVQASDGRTGTQFGRSVAVDGATLVAGADDSGNGGRGGAYVFERAGGTFAERAKLTATDGASGDQLGSSVAVSGDRVAVGAVRDDIGANDMQGSVYLFRRPPGGWAGGQTQSQKIFPADGQAIDFLGAGVAFSGRSVVTAGAAGTSPRGAWVFGEDDAPPVTTIRISPPDGNEGWHRTPVTITVTATDGPDGAGAVSTRCSLDQAFTPAVYEELPAGCAVGRGAVIADEGGHVVHAASRDGLGNTEALRSAGFRIDSTPPVVRCGPVRSFARGSRDGVVTATVTDALSGPATPVATTVAATGRTGARKATVTGADRAGNTTTVECEYDVLSNGLPFCGTRDVMLVDARHAGRKRPRLRLRGIARERFAGRTVQVRRGSRLAGTAKVGRDGRFTVLVSRPRSRTSYVAVLGDERSASLRYDSRLAIVRERRRGRRHDVDLRVRGRRTVTIMRRTGCRKLRRHARVRRGRSSTVRLRLRPALSDVALYEARVRIGKRTIRIPVAVD